MAEDSSKYCTLIDKFGEVGKKNADYKKVFDLLADRCMLSLLTKRVTFLLPVGKALKELEKMSPAKQREHIKRHLIGGAFEKEELEGRDRVYTRATIDKSRRVAYVVAGKGASLTIGGVKVGKVAMKVTGSTKEGKEIPTGIAYEIEELLPEAGEEVPLRPRVEKGKGSSKSRAEQAGGGSPFEYLVERDIAHLLDLSGHDLRWSIIEQYRNSWPISVFGLDSEYAWYQWATASLVSFLAEQIPDFYWVYSPYLGLDPFSTLDLLFEYHVQDAYHRYILPDDLIKKWIQSNMYLYSDPILLSNAMTFLAGGGSKTGGDPTFPKQIISLNPDLSSRYVVTGKEAINEYIRFNSPEKIREGIVKVYKKVYEEPDVLLGETRSIYEQVDKQPFVVAMQNDLRRFFDDRFRYHSEFDSLYPSFLHCNICKPNKGLFNWFTGGGGNKDSNALWFVKSVLQYDPYSLTIDLGESNSFRFPHQFLLDFINSRWFMWMPSLANVDFKAPKLTPYKVPKSADISIYQSYPTPTPMVPGPVFPGSDSVGVASGFVPGAWNTPATGVGKSDDKKITPGLMMLYNSMNQP